LRELLSEDASIYVHLDWHLVHYCKPILDELFGYDNFQREIIWWPNNVSGFKGKAENWIRDHDTLLFYTKSVKEFNFNKQWKPLSEEYIKQTFVHVDKDGRRFRWRYDRKQFYEENEGIPISDVWDIAYLRQNAIERNGYPTQKPATLIERIIKASSNENDLILDCFIGSGTTAAVSEKLNRRWIACDLGRFAIHTTRKRLLGIENVKPFVVQNLGKYERQQWAKAEFENPESRAIQDKAYHNFILELYDAEPLTGYIWLHGAKAGRMIHVGSVDAPVSLGDIKNISQEFWKAVGKSKDIKTNGIDILGWDFAFEINETAKQYAASNKIDIKFKKIPREVLEKRAVEQGDIQFFELASFEINTKVDKKKLTLTLTDFIIPPDDIPEEVRKAITHWSQCIDYWAVDWNYKDDTFHNEWQSYRTKKSPQIELSSIHDYETFGQYIVLVKVIDILGNDTTKAITVNIK
jgi:DNA modification methylase